MKKQTYPDLLIDTKIVVLPACPAFAGAASLIGGLARRLLRGSIHLPLYETLK